MGDGFKIRFWHYLWCGNQPLKTDSSDLFCLPRCKEAWVVDHMQFFNENFRWNISFTRLVHDWEVDFVTFFDLLYSN